MSDADLVELIKTCKIVDAFQLSNYNYAVCGGSHALSFQLASKRRVVLESGSDLYTLVNLDSYCVSAAWCGVYELLCDNLLT
jgi:hypothetical protein